MKRIVAACALFCLAVSGRAQTEYPFPVFQTDGFSFYTLNDEDISGADMHVTSTPALIVEMPTTMDEATVLDLTTPRLVWADTGGRLDDTAGAIWDATNAGIAIGSVGSSAQFDWSFGAFPFAADTAVISRAEGSASSSEKPFAVVHYGGSGMNDGFYYAHADGTFASPSDLSIGGVDTILSYYGYKTGAFRRMSVIDVEPITITTFGVQGDVTINSFLGGWTFGSDGGLWSNGAAPYLDMTTNGPIVSANGQFAFGDADAYHLFYTGDVPLSPYGEGVLALANDVGVVQVTVDGNSGEIATTGALDVDGAADVGGALTVVGDLDVGGGDLTVDASTGYVDIASGRWEFKDGGYGGIDLFAGSGTDFFGPAGMRWQCGTAGTTNDFDLRDSSANVQLVGTSTSGTAEVNLGRNGSVDSIRLITQGSAYGGTRMGITGANGSFLMMNGTNNGIGTEIGADLQFATASTVCFTLTSGGYGNFTNGVNVGTATDATAQGDLAAGLTGAARIHYDQSDDDLDGYDSGGALSWKIDATAGGATVFNEDSDDIDFRIETDSTSNALLVDAGANAVQVNSWFGLGNGSSLTIASGAVTAANSHIFVDTEASAASDDLDTINFTGGKAGDILVASAADSARTVVFKDGTGNLKLAGDFTADNAEDRIVLMRLVTELVEIARSDNGA